MAGTESTSMTCFRLLRSTGKDAETVDSGNFFDINNANEYCWVDGQDPNTVDLSLHWIADRRIKNILIVPVFHMYENQALEIPKWLEDERVKVIANFWDPNVLHARFYFCDYLWNRQKAYAENYPFSPSTKKWYYTTPLDYTSKSLSKCLKQPKKIFLSPIRMAWPRSGFRRQLFEIMTGKYQHLGHISCHDEDRFLISNSNCPNTSDIDTVSQKKIGHCKGFSPPHQAFYDDTFISIYGETIEFGSTIGITEKTFTPLMRGHFILPFSTKGFVKYLMIRGVQLPTFIDYSYDNVENFDRRCEIFFDEVQRLLSLKLDRWYQHYSENLEILIYNQKWFDNDYDRVDLNKLLDR